jgi:hypothetical protein
MGTLFYGERTDISFEDRTLFHLQIVIGAKLRRGEAFFFTWKEDVATGSGRGSIWIQRSIPLVFALRTSRRKPALARATHRLGKLGARALPVGRTTRRGRQHPRSHSSQ